MSYKLSHFCWISLAVVFSIAIVLVKRITRPRPTPLLGLLKKTQ